MERRWRCVAQQGWWCPKISKLWELDEIRDESFYKRHAKEEGSFKWFEEIDQLGNVIEEAEAFKAGEVNDGELDVGIRKLHHETQKKIKRLAEEKGEDIKGLLKAFGGVELQYLTNDQAKNMVVFLEGRKDAKPAETTDMPDGSLEGIPGMGDDQPSAEV